MHHGNVEECPLREREIRDRVSVVEAFHVWPVFLSVDNFTLGCTKRHLTVECLREDLVEIPLVIGETAVIRASMGVDPGPVPPWRGRMVRRR
jgi:hypothetical protein